MAGTPSLQPLSRRDRRKAETISDIKAVALRQLAAAGPAGISMRAIARDLDMTAAGVHYYYPDRQSLINALTVDGFTSLAATLRSVYDEGSCLAPRERWLTVARAWRAWALTHSAEYLLIYGHTGGAARRVNEHVAKAMASAVGVLFASMRNCVRHGDIDVPRLGEAMSPALREQFAAWRCAADGVGDLPDGALAACMLTYSRLHGAVVLELMGHIPPQLTDHGALFDMEMEHTTDALHPLSAPAEIATEVDVPGQAPWPS
jgi:AcrR family transcriptional regulator